jgi:hypothetical protein
MRLFVLNNVIARRAFVLPDEAIFAATWFRGKTPILKIV